MTPEIFHCRDAVLHTLPGRPTLRSATSEQLHEHLDKVAIQNAEILPQRFGARPNDEEGFYASACHSMLLSEDYWRQCGLVWAWIDETPTWESPVHWTCGSCGILPEPDRPTLRRFRLSLLGGGQIRVSEQYEPMESEIKMFICYQPELRVTTDAGNGLRRFTGIISGGQICEMSTKAVLFAPGTPQAIADRTAATFRLLCNVDPAVPDVRPPDPENFAALLDRGERCCVCRRPLRDHVSTLLGIGPDCAKQMGLPHGLEAANRILQRRKELLGSEAGAAA
jgi:hypothetical protein